ncbi:serine/threonine-protein kinase [Streptomyces sp. NPDC048664]|uniref:serine/threonine-protein kinase n=1 Tax=Streptomyces sp. NPDC048664 TaxID=3154505 RepID=UPI003445C5F3
MEKLHAGDPQRIGAYRLLARLGAGGMGRVYLARSDRGRTVAVKLVRRELAEQEEFRARFRQEVRAARQVGGYWTAPVLDADTEAEIPWVATGYVAGPSLYSVVSREHGALPERTVRILAAGLAHALQDIHAAGLIHRDLKPSNVLVTIDGPRVIDFGIARALQTPGADGLTRTGALVGSPGFMAPEQVRGDRITPACDVFCLGSVLAYAATGSLPFGATDSGVHAQMFRIAQEKPDLDGMPEELADLVRDCLHKDPDARPTPARILERTGAEDTVSGGRSRDPWLPGSLVAQLGRHAVRLLDAEDPQEAAAADGPATVQLTKQPPAPMAAPAPEDAPRAPGHAPVGDARAGAGAPRPAPVAAGAPTPAEPPTAGATAGAAAGAPGTPPPVSAAPPHPAYGYPQQHQAYASYGPYGSPQQHAPGPTPPYGPPPYTGTGTGTGFGPAGYGAVPAPSAPRGRSGRATAALVIAALVVALGAGGSVFALMKGTGSTTGAAAGTPTTPDTGTAAPAPPDTAAPGSPAPSSRPSGGGAVPDAYLGTWTASIDSATSHSTRQLVIRQGKVGDAVLSVTADGPAGAGSYHCVFEARLSGAPAGNGPLEIGPSTVVVGQPASSCTPGGATRLTVLAAGALQRVNTSTGESLTYVKKAH